MRSPITQNGRSGPITTVLDGDSRTVSTQLPFSTSRNAEAAAQARDARLIARLDAEAAAKIALRAGGDKSEHRVGRNRDAILEKTVDCFIDGAIAAGYQNQFGPAIHFLVEQLIGMNTRVSSQRLNGTFYAHNEIAPIVDAGTPVLLINGDDDPRGTTGHMEKIGAQIPGSKLVIVPGGGHLVYLENADPYNREVLDFLAAHPGE